MSPVAPSLLSSPRLRLATARGLGDMLWACASDAPARGSGVSYSQTVRRSRIDCCVSRVTLFAGFGDGFAATLRVLNSARVACSARIEPSGGFFALTVLTGRDAHHAPAHLAERALGLIPDGRADRREFHRSLLPNHPPGPHHPPLRQVIARRLAHERTEAGGECRAGHRHAAREL